MTGAYRVSWGYCVASLAYMAGIFWLSSLPRSATGPDTPTWRFLSNAFHVPLYGGLGLCLAMALGGWPWPRRAAGAIAVGLAHAIFDEWHQSWAPGRYPSVEDVALDMAGICLSVLCVWAMSRHRGLAANVEY